jgi:WS/DGAT/MGAT family acyltransferase
MQQLSAQDASFIYSETPNAHMHVATLSLYDQSTAPGGHVRFRDILHNIERRLHLAKCFRRKLVEVPGGTDHPYWIEDRDFDLEFHVRHVALPPPGDWRQFCKQAARLHSYPLDRSKPLWELTVISGVRAVEAVPEGSFGLMLKIHHAAIDGASGAALTEVLHDLSASADGARAPDVAWHGEAEPTPLELMSRSAFNNFLQPFRAAEVWSRTAPALARVRDAFRSNALKPIGPVPRTRFNGRVTPHRVFDGRCYRLDDLRAIKRAVEGATINDVVLTIVGGALRRYLSQMGELPNDSLIAMAPINVRTVDEKNTEGNRVAAMLASLGTHVADPLERLALVRDSTHNSKEFTAAIGARLMTDYGHFVPARLAALAARLYTATAAAERGTPSFNCVVTNVPGPQAPLYMSGARLERLYGMGPVSDGAGLIFPVFSYCGGITIAVCGCRDTLPDVERLTDDLDASAAALLHATAR